MMRSSALFLCLLHGAAASFSSSLEMGYGERSLQAMMMGTMNGLPEGITECESNELASGMAPSYLSRPFAFCVNDGTCRRSYESDSDDGSFQFCDCPDGFAGPHCEFYDSDVPDCSLDCMNGGSCHVGAKTWQQVHTGIFWQEMSDHMYCLCQEGFYGTECEHEGPMCGDNYCYHGGTCVDVESTDGTVHQHCDCTTATSEDGTVSHAGEFCQHEATSYCSDRALLDGHQMCLNGGICRTDGRAGCDCPAGFVGPVCEFVDLDLEPQRCDLECFNHGVCRKGSKDMSAMETFNSIGRRELKMMGHNDDFEHCVCPVGFVGLQCEWELDVCPGSLHVCMNGGKCQLDFSGDRVNASCDCSGARTAHSLFAGDYCELESTDICAESSGFIEDDEPAFCANGGTCKKKVVVGSPHPGCDCPGDFSGDHCQYVVKESPLDLKFILIIAGTGLAVLILGFLIYRRRSRAARTRRAAVTSQAYRNRNLHDPPVSTVRNNNNNKSQRGRMTRASPFGDSNSITSDSSNESRRRMDRTALDLGRVASSASHDPVFVFHDNSNDEHEEGRGRRAVV